jgi:hypothetical protein
MEKDSRKAKLQFSRAKFHPLLKTNLGVTGAINLHTKIQAQRI